MYRQLSDMLSISRCSTDFRPNMHQWEVKLHNVLLTMIRRHPQRVKSKNRYKVYFPPWILAGSGIKISLSLQGFLGVFTSRTDRLWAPWISGTNIKGEAKPGCISYHLVSLCLPFPGFWTRPYITPEWRLSRHTQSVLTAALWLMCISFDLT